MKMLFDGILVKGIAIETKGKVLIDDERQKHKDIAKGVVLEVGPGQSYGLPKYEPTMVKQGDIIYYLKDQAMKLMVKDEECWVIRERDCLGVEE